MRARRGQSGTIVRKGDQWHVRFYADDEKVRKKKSVPVGPAVGKGRLTKSEAARKGADIVEKAGVNTQAHLTRAEHPESAETLTQRVEWCRRFHRAWTESKPGSLTSMESNLTKHILPRSGELLVEQVTEKAVQEWVADLGRQTFEMRKPNGSVIKTYSLSRKSILNIVGVLKLVLGRKAWMSWEALNLGKKPLRSKQRYFTEEQLKQIIDASGQHRVLFAVLAGTGMRIGEAAGLYVEDVDIHSQVIHVRRGVWKGQDLAPKTENAIREVDIDETLTTMLRLFIGERKAGRLFQSLTGRRWPTEISVSACSIHCSNGWGFPERGCTRSGIHV
jgi:integrase